MNKLTLLIVERGILTDLNIFNHSNARMGWLTSMKYLEDDSPNGEIKYQEHFTMMKTIVEDIRYETERDLKHELKTDILEYPKINVIFPQVLECFDFKPKNKNFQY